MCRLGVSPQNPAVRKSVALGPSPSASCVKQSPLIFQGGSWLHVGTDQPFKSISIGGANQVWAIAKDGAVFYRGSVSQQNPAGKKEPSVWSRVQRNKRSCLHLRGCHLPDSAPLQENAGTTSRPPLGRRSDSCRWAGLLSLLWMKTVSSSQRFSALASVKRSCSHSACLQGTCGTGRASPPATPRVPPGSSSPTMSPKCPWDRWTRSEQETLA